MKLKDAIKNISKATGAQEIENSSLAKVTEFLSTGSYAINRVLSGSIYKGFPVGRISTIAGESQSGKSLLVANTIIEALKNDVVDVVYIFDSEGGVLVDYFKANNIDMSKINHIPVISLEQCAVKMLNLYDTLVTARQDWLNDPDNNDNIRALVVLDSIGGLSSDKLITDAVKKDQMVADMGSSAKLRNNLMRGLMMRVPMSNATLLIVNHIYDDPSAGMFGASKIKAMGGGRGLVYSSHVILQCDKLLVKSNNDEFMTGEENDDDSLGFYKGNRLRFFVVKSRVAKPAFQATVYLSFEHGFNKWDGLVEDATNWGYIQNVRGGVVVPSYSDKKITRKELITNDAVWKSFINDFEKKSIEKMAYSNQTSAKIDEIENELNSDVASI